MFTKEERSTFKYWFAHWCAFQMTALNLHVWRFRYLLHDIEKPWLRLLFRGDYKKVQSWHRRHNRLHLEYPGKKNYLEMVLDWESGRFTKQTSPETAFQWLEREKCRISKEDYIGVIEALTSLGLYDGKNEVKLEDINYGQ